MIIDTYENINFYFGMSKELNAALTVLKHYDLSSLPPGEYLDFPFSGSNVLLRIIEAETQIDGDNIPWEYHEKHIDVQYVLKGGSEILGYSPRSKLGGWTKSDDDDVVYSTDHSNYLPIKLEEGDFAIFFPQDAHRKLESCAREKYRKIVIKVPIEGFNISKLK